MRKVTFLIIQSLLGMDPILFERLSKEFPGLADLATQRLLGNGSVFFHRNHKPKFPEAEIFAALLVATTWARRAGAEIQYSRDESRIWKKHLKVVKFSRP
jgi:hypothetical protein